MEKIIIGIVSGVIGTIVMDLLNYLFARAGLISKIDISMIGRMAAGWFRGQFLYKNPVEMKQVKNEKIYGIIGHYLIGIIFAMFYVFGWYFITGEVTSVFWAVPYGILTTFGSWFLIYPSLGMGIFGIRSPEGIKSTFSSMANHLFFGIGIAVGIALL